MAGKFKTLYNNLFKVFIESLKPILAGALMIIIIVGVVQIIGLIIGKKLLSFEKFNKAYEQEDKYKDGQPKKLN